MEGDQGTVGISPTIEGGDSFPYQLFKGAVVLGGEDEKEKVVGEERDDEDVDEEDAGLDGERGRNVGGGG